MRGDLVNLNIKAYNKQCSGLTVKCLEIPHYAYSNRCKQYPQMRSITLNNQKMRIQFRFIFTIFFCFLPLFSIAQMKPAARDTFNWKSYYSNSFAAIDSINYEILKGNWIASSTTTFADYVIGSSSIDKNSGVLEIKGDKYRDTNAGSFYTYHFYKNMIVFNRETCSDTAYINRINKKELVISFKRDTNYIQYHYYK